MILGDNRFHHIIVDEFDEMLVQKLQFIITNSKEQIEFFAAEGKKE